MSREEFFIILFLLSAENNVLLSSDFKAMTFNMAQKSSLILHFLIACIFHLQITRRNYSAYKFDTSECQ